MAKHCHEKCTSRQSAYSCHSDMVMKDNLFTENRDSLYIAKAIVSL